jgi:hypothetical protein
MLLLGKGDSIKMFEKQKSHQNITLDGYCIILR